MNEAWCVTVTETTRYELLQLLRYQVPSLSTKHLDVLVNCFLQCDGEAVDSSMVRLVTHVSVLIALVVIAIGLYHHASS